MRTLQFLERENSPDYTPTSERIENAIQVLLGDDFREEIDFFQWEWKW